MHWLGQTVLALEIRKYKIVFTCLSSKSALVLPIKHKSDIVRLGPKWEKPALLLFRILSFHWRLVTSLLASSAPPTPSTFSCFCLLSRISHWCPITPCLLKRQGNEAKVWLWSKYLSSAFHKSWPISLKIEVIYLLLEMYQVRSKYLLNAHWHCHNWLLDLWSYN